VVALLVALLGAQTVGFTVDLRTINHDFEVVGVPRLIDTDADSATDEWLIHFKLAAIPPGEPPQFGFQILAVRNGDICRSPTFGSSSSPDISTRVYGTRLLLRDGDTLTEIRLLTPACP
jgi:hypothetical protein